MHSPDLSIIIPVYNVEKHLLHCVRSFWQENENQITTEMLLIDDGSPDNSSLLSDELAYENIAVITVHKHNNGLSSSRNAGMDIASGNCIYFADSDDVVAESFFTLIKKCSEQKSDIAVFSYSVDYTETGTCEEYLLSDSSLIASQAVLEAEKREAFNFAWNKVYARQLLEKEPKIRFALHKEPGEDLIFNCECFKRAETVQLSSSVLYHWIRRGEDTLANKFREDLWDKNRFFISCRNALYEHWRLTEPEEKDQLYAGNLEYVFCCVPNMYRGKGKTFRRTKRMAFYREILADKEIALWVKESKTSSLLMKLFLSLYKSRSAVLMDLVFSVLMGMRNTFNGLWIAVRQKAQR